MASIRYRGRYPDADAVLAHKQFVDDQWAAVRVDNAYLDSQTDPVVATLTTASYVDGRDATKATTTYVDAQDALAVPLTQRGAASGVAPLNASVQVPAANVPSGIVTDRIPATGTLVTNLTANQAVSSSTNTKEYLAATRTVADPGYPWVPLITGQVMGFANASADPGNGLGCGVYGQGIVFDANNAVWGRVVTTSNYRLQAFPILPWALSGAAPAALTGPMVLSLYLSLYATPGGTTTSYVFSPTQFAFGVVAMPGI